MCLQDCICNPLMHERDTAISHLYWTICMIRQGHTDGATKMCSYGNMHFERASKIAGQYMMGT